MAWNDLTISQRSYWMNRFRKEYGINSLQEMKRVFDLHSPSLVETGNPLLRQTAPVYAQGGPKSKGRMESPQGVDEYSPDFVGPVLPKSAYNGPEVPYGFYDAPIDWERKKALQHYNESSFKANQVSPAGAMGPYQIMPKNWETYSKKLGLTGTAQDYNNSEAVRDRMMEELLQAKWVNKGFPSDSVRAAKALMAYNWGSGNATKFLENMKNQGVEIYHSMDWIDKIPSKETRNYVNYILRERDIPGGKTIEAFERALPHRFDDLKRANRYAGGGPEKKVERRNYNGTPTTLEKYKQYKRDEIINSAVQNALNRTRGVAPVIKGNLGESCLYTATDNFGRQYRVAGNQTFLSNPQKYGFIVNGPVEDAKIGDLYQMFDYEDVSPEAIPHHMTLITGYDSSGKPLVTYSQGDVTQDNDYKKNQNLWSTAKYETYRFIGTPEDNAKWETEYYALPEYDVIPPVNNKLNELTKGYRLNRGGYLYGPGGSLSPINPRLLAHKASDTLRSFIPKKLARNISESANSYTGLGNIAKGLVSSFINKENRERLNYLEEEYPDPGYGFLLDDNRQRKYMEEMGYHLVDDTNYGMVNKAAKNLMNKTGKAKISIYQLGEDDIDPALVKLISTDPKIVNQYHVPTERQLNHASYHPKALYEDTEGNHYVKAWDLNDYGQHNGNIGTKFSDWIMGYNSKIPHTSGASYGANQFLAEMYDFIGNPFIQRTGLVKVKEPNEQENEVLERLKDALTNFRPSYKSGGKIHIKPENRGKFTALKKRTGHSASWFKANGTPAQKKMAVFALNAKHWGKKKAYGGIIF